MEHPLLEEGASWPGGRRRGKGLAQRLAVARELIGYAEEDEQLVYASRGTLVAHSDVIVGAVYGHLLSHQETATHFERPDGHTDRDTVQAHDASLREWLVVAIEAPLDAQLSAYLLEVGRAHTGRGREPRARVEARYLLATIGFLHAEIIRVLEGAIDDRTTLVASVIAWGKLLMIHLDLFLAVYASAEGTAHWY